jgi:hypothetical protein
MQVPSAMLQHQVESLPRRGKAVIAAKGGSNSILMPMIFDDQVSTYNLVHNMTKSM